jgi:hypothetical protein
VKGDGRHRISASYGQYASHIVEGIASANSSAGAPATIDFAYQGPSFNTTTLDTPMADVIRQVFQYFNTTQGGTNNTSTANLRNNGVRFVPGYAAYFNGSLSSPYVDEWTLGYGMQIGATGFAKVDLISRDWKNFYSQQVTSSTPHVTTPLNIPVDLLLVTNSDNIRREYRAAQFQARYNPTRFQLGLTYTYATLKGNDDGENAASGPLANNDTTAYYPEYLNYANYAPFGYLQGDQRHRARAWVGYEIPMPAAFGRLNVSLLQNFDSGIAYSASVLVNNSQGIDVTSYAGAPKNLGYNSVPNGSYFFGGRGKYRTDDITSTNLALRYSLRISRGEFFAQGDLLNAFNEQGLNTIANIQTSVTTSVSNAALTPFNPFTQTPVAGVNYQLASNFGQALTKDAYQLPRTYRFSVGVRF